MNSTFLKNIEAFKAEIPALSRLSGSTSKSVELFPSRSGPTTGRFKDILLHSSYDPTKEAAGFASKITSGSRIGLYGFGLGYHIKALLNKIGPEGELIVIELNPDVLTAAFSLNDMAYLAKDPRFQLVYSDTETEAADKISEAMGRLCPEDGQPPILLFHPSSYECLPKKFPNILRALEVLRLERKVPALFGNLEQQNAEINWGIVTQSPGIRMLQNKFPSKPAILVSAGPSLDGMMHFLPALTDFCITGCVDTAFPLLESASIQADYVFSVDPQNESFFHFENHLASQTSLVFQPTSHPRIIRHFQGNKFVVFKDGHKITLDHASLAAEKGMSKAGGSVSCLALDCLIQMGCDPILLVGQDCAFPGGRVYGRKAENQLEEATNLTREIAAGGLQNTRSRRYEKIKVPGCHGQNLFTSPALFSYLRTIEQIAETHPEIRILNLSSQGAHIERAPYIGSLKELMNLFPDCGIL
ncbi:MAG: motility associated factor glycosyltransferase family protein [Candidatus Nitronauta litoralis]|uniref:Motility associated factor glycosyltransferase family protein n=1 Tax=Candidatus Nitronauta litoralis TaxID=2705533 RepID=A0A7T0BXJ9_9BACT|nr:MAG: motility associated factor glycosyltransferase family protein [Candidatus Nitronauta litoralis]